MSRDNMINSVYDLGTELGSGSYGSVFEATAKGCEEGDRRYAVKIFKPNCPRLSILNELAINRVLVRLREEGKAQNIIKVWDLDLLSSNGQNACICMELLTGGELYAFIEQSYKNGGGITERRVARTMHALASGLANLHANNILHRDIKPENIVYRSEDADSTPVIVDYGFAVQARTDTSLNAVPGNIVYEDAVALRNKTSTGSPGYIAPESLTYFRYYNTSDIWSLGCILYILLCGNLPFDCRKGREKALQLQTMRGDYYPLDGPNAGKEWENISVSAKDLVKKMLVVEPNKRYTALQVLEHPWVVANASSKARRGSAPSISRGNSSASTLSSTGPSRVNSIFAAVCGTSTILQSGSSATDTELLVDGHLVGADHGGLEDNPQQQNYDDDNNEYDESGECSPRNTPADVIFDDDYAKRVNLMSNMRKLKKLVNGIIWTNRLRKAAIQSALNKTDVDVEPNNINSASMRVTGGGNHLPCLASSVQGLSLSMPPPDADFSAASGLIRQPSVYAIDDRTPRDGEQLPLGASVNITGASGLIRQPSVYAMDDRTPRNGDPKQGTNFSNATSSLDNVPSSFAASSSSSSVSSTLVVSIDQIGKLQSRFLTSRSNTASSSVASVESPGKSHTNTANSPHNAPIASAKSDTPQSTGRRLRRLSSAVLERFFEGDGVNYEEFCMAVKEVGLDVLASERIFKIFDVDGNGSISPDEFIATLAQFQNTSCTDVTDPDYKSKRTKLYFSLFDLDGDGLISRSELAQVAGLLTQSNTNTYRTKYDGVAVFDISPEDLLTDVDIDSKGAENHRNDDEDVDFVKLFDAIDADDSGYIDFAEFAAWFDTHQSDQSTTQLFSVFQQDAESMFGKSSAVTE